jgi:hypothetical protein
MPYGPAPPVGNAKPGTCSHECGQSDHQLAGSRRNTMWFHESKVYNGLKACDVIVGIAEEQSEEGKRNDVIKTTTASSHGKSQWR